MAVVVEAARCDVQPQWSRAASVEPQRGGCDEIVDHERATQRPPHRAGSEEQVGGVPDSGHVLEKNVERGLLARLRLLEIEHEAAPDLQEAARDFLDRERRGTGEPSRQRVFAVHGDRDFSHATGELVHAPSAAGIVQRAGEIAHHRLRRAAR